MQRRRIRRLERSARHCRDTGS